jgi:hypothetical protein
MSLTIDYNHEDKTLYSDNTLVARTKWGHQYLSIHITDHGASISRYCVPGRIDSYNFSWVPDRRGGIGDRVVFFTDTALSLTKALKLVKKDLKNKYVKELLTAVNLKLKRHYLVNLLEALR